MNSAALIRDNVIVNTKGPGSMVYGATNTAKVSVIERNAAFGSRTSSATLVGGGPAIVRNNVASGGAEGGIRGYDYQRRGVVRGIALLHNTVYDNARGGIRVDGLVKDPAVLLINNAVHARYGTLTFPPLFTGRVGLGNVDCSELSCFVQPENRNFPPAAGSPLQRHGRVLTEPWMPKDDFTGIERGSSPTVGAFEAPAPPIPLGFKRPVRPENHEK